MNTRAYTITFDNGTTIVVTAEDKVDVSGIFAWAKSKYASGIASVSYKYVANHFYYEGE